MKRLMGGLAAALVCGQVAMAAQTKTMDKPMMMKDGAMTVTGCVTAGKGAGQYMLSNAMMGDAMMTDKDKMAKPGMMADSKMSYELMGGGDMKMHMGHKVEVMGTMDKATMEMMAKMSDKEKMDKMSAMTTPMKLDVKSVKMIAATCP